MKNQTALRYWTIAGALYMLLISISHLMQIKVPGVFVFPYTTSYIYQDRLIGMLAFGWSCWLWEGVRRPESLRLIPLAGIVCILVIWWDVIWFPDEIEQGHIQVQQLTAALQTLYLVVLLILLRRFRS